MKQKTIFYTELAYIFAVILLALATALSTLADFGLSPVAAPSYLLHLKLSQYHSFFTFGKTEIIVQLAILIITSAIIGKFKKSFLLSFGTAAFFGVVLDIWLFILTCLPTEYMIIRILMFTASIIICSISISLFFKTYLPPAAYEVAVKEITDKFKLNTGKFKTIFDCICLVAAIILSLCFFRKLEGIGIGTIISAVCNGFLINKFNNLYNKIFEFKNKLKSA